MGYINANLLNNLQSDSATNEARRGELGLIDAVLGSTPAVTFLRPSDRAALREISSQRKVEVPYMLDQEVEVRTGPSFNIPANLETTDKLAYQAYDVFSGFRHYKASYANNQIDQDFAIRQKILNINYKMAQKIEEIFQTILELRKTQKLDFTLQASHDGTINFDTGTDTLQVDLPAQKSTMFFALQRLMEANDIGGDYRLITSRGGLIRQMAEAMKYGAANDKNLNALGFLPQDRIHETGTVSAGSDIFNGYMFKNGSIGAIENFPWDFVNGTKTADGREWSISDMAMPFTNMRANIFTNSQPTDATALIKLVDGKVDSNLQMTAFEEMAIWHRFYVVFEPNSDLENRVNTVIKLKGLNSTI